MIPLHITKSLLPKIEAFLCMTTTGQFCHHLCWLHSHFKPKDAQEVKRCHSVKISHLLPGCYFKLVSPPYPFLKNNYFIQLPNRNYAWTNLFWAFHWYLDNCFRVLGWFTAAPRPSWRGVLFLQWVMRGPWDPLRKSTKTLGCFYWWLD